MSNTSVTTGTSATTYTMPFPCGGDFGDGPCVWREMHHTDEDGRHWCPTGFLYCHTHGGIGTISGSATCTYWDERP